MDVNSDSGSIYYNAEQAREHKGVVSVSIREDFRDFMENKRKNSQLSPKKQIN